MRGVLTVTKQRSAAARRATASAGGGGGVKLVRGPDRPRTESRPSAASPHGAGSAGGLVAAVRTAHLALSVHATLAPQRQTGLSADYLATEAPEAPSAPHAPSATGAPQRNTSVGCDGASAAPSTRARGAVATQWAAMPGRPGPPSPSHPRRVALPPAATPDPAAPQCALCGAPPPPPGGRAGIAPGQSVRGVVVAVAPPILAPPLHPRPLHSLPLPLPFMMSPGRRGGGAGGAFPPLPTPLSNIRKSISKTTLASGQALAGNVGPQPLHVVTTGRRRWACGAPHSPPPTPNR